MRPCSSTVRTFTPGGVLCAVGYGDLRADPAWPLFWKTPCLCLHVSAQRSGVWSWGGLLWVTVGFHGPPGGSVLRQGSQSFSLTRSPPPGAHQDTDKLPGCCCSVSKSCPTICDHMDRSMPSFPVLHYLLEFAQTHSHWVTMPSNHLILCLPLLLLPSTFPSIRVFSNESAFPIRWSKYWSFSFSVSSSNEYSQLISFQIDWFDLLAVQGTLKSLCQHHSSKTSVLQCSAFFMVQLSHPYMLTRQTIDHMDLACLHIRGLPTTAMVPWSRECVTPR